MQNGAEKPTKNEPNLSFSLARTVVRSVSGGLHMKTELGEKNPIEPNV